MAECRGMLAVAYWRLLIAEPQTDRGFGIADRQYIAAESLDVRHNGCDFVRKNVFRAVEAAQGRVFDDLADVGRNIVNQLDSQGDVLRPKLTPDEALFVSQYVKLP